jgi:hypothetical protein
MGKQRTTTNRLWGRTTKALGKLWAGMLSLADDRRENQRPWNDYPHFPPY